MPATRRRARLPPRPIITLTSDFGLRDSYVAEMKGALLAGCPEARLIDVAHDLPRHDVAAAALILFRLMRAMPPDSIHLVVVDPGVGAARAGLLARVARQWFAGPDNGLLSLAWRAFGGEAYALPTPPRASPVFHGRDVFAPAAARLARGEPARRLGAAIPAPAALPWDFADPSSRRGRVLHADRFGNAVTDILVERLPSPPTAVRVGRRALPLRRTYADVAPGAPLALVGSAGLIEIAVREGSAVERLRLRPGSTLTWS